MPYPITIDRIIRIKIIKLAILIMPEEIRMLPTFAMRASDERFSTAAMDAMPPNDSKTITQDEMIDTIVRTTKLIKIISPFRRFPA